MISTMCITYLCLFVCKRYCGEMIKNKYHNRFLSNLWKSDFDQQFGLPPPNTSSFLAMPFQLTHSIFDLYAGNIVGSFGYSLQSILPVNLRNTPVNMTCFSHQLFLNLTLDCNMCWLCSLVHHLSYRTTYIVSIFSYNSSRNHFCGQACVYYSLNVGTMSVVVYYLHIYLV